MDIYVSYTCLKITSVFHITLNYLNENVNILLPRYLFVPKIYLSYFKSYLY